ncbi:MAG: trehalose-6-phosphate synthase [Nitrolancea sp.]
MVQQAQHKNGDGGIPAAGLSESARHLLERRRLIIASNRGPIEFQIEEDGSYSTKRGSGGVVTAVGAISRFSDLTWVASAMTDGDRQRALEAQQAGETMIRTPDSDVSLRFVLADSDAYDGYYNRISNPLLWFLQHYLWDTPRAPDINEETWHAWRHGYVPVNRQFANEIVEVAKVGEGRPLVMLQDYHLYLVPGQIREMMPNVMMQHFIHIPWPDPDYWQLLPREMRSDICKSLLGNDIVGFQTDAHARSFMNTCEANLDGVDLDYRGREIHYHGRTTRVAAYPISIDCDAVEAVAAGEEAFKHEEHLENFLNDYTIVRVDRAEPSKNIVRGFLAYDRFLEEFPDFIGRVNFLAYLVPSRLEVLEYVDYLDDINTIVGRINTKYANAAENDGVAWQPIQVFIGDDYPRALAAMKHYNVLMVNAIFDGMNLVAKEGALLNKRDGVMILSEAAGAYQQLGPYSLTVSPTDVEGTAAAIHTALTMSPDKRAGWSRDLRDLVRRENIRTWIYAQLEDLARLPETTS